MKLLLACVLLLSCMGCTVGPKYQVPAAPAKANWAAPAQAAAPSNLPQWWKNFSDSELNDLIDTAVTANPDLAASTARVLEARSNFSAARANLLPNVTSSTGVTRQRQRFFAGQGTNGPNLIPIVYNNYQTQWDASWEIDLFGRLRNEVSAQRAEIDASQDDRNNVLLTLVSDVGRYYIMLRGEQQRLAIARRNIEIEQDTLKLTKDLAQAGQSTEREVAQAEAQLDSIQATVPQIQTSIDESIFRLGVLTGQEPGALKTRLTTEKPLPPAPPDLPAGLPLDLLKRRPDIQKAEAQLRAATYRIGAAQAEYFPSLTLAGSAGRQALQLHELSLGTGNIFSIGPSVTLPVFDSGRIRSQVRLRQAQAQEAAANYKASVLASFEDVEKALTELSAEQTRMNQLEAQVKANQTALELSRVQYNAGLADFLTVLTSERDLFSATDQLATSKTSLDLDVVTLYKSLGGGWQNP